MSKIVTVVNKIHDVDFLEINPFRLEVDSFSDD
jgi:hypothetical protein